MPDSVGMQFTARERSLPGYVNILRVDRRVRCRWRTRCGLMRLALSLPGSNLFAASYDGPCGSRAVHSSPLLVSENFLNFFRELLSPQPGYHGGPCVGRGVRGSPFRFEAPY